MGVLARPEYQIRTSWSSPPLAGTGGDRRWCLLKFIAARFDARLEDTQGRLLAALRPRPQEGSVPDQCGPVRRRCRVYRPHRDQVRQSRLGPVGEANTHVAVTSSGRN